MRALTHTCRTEIEKLVRDTGHEPTIDDFDEIARLNDLAAKIEKPEDAEEREILFLPVRVGNILIGPLTLAAAGWLDERALPWLEGKPMWSDMVVAYAMDQAVTLDDLLAIPDRKALVSVLRKWRRRLKCTANQLLAAIEKFIPDSDNTEPAEHQKYGPVIELLCREYGNSPDYWLHEASIPLIQSMLTEFRLRNEAEAMAQYHAAVRAGAKGVHHPKTMKLTYMKQFRDGINALRDTWLKM